MSATDILKEHKDWMTISELVAKLAKIIQKEKPSIKKDSAKRKAYRKMAKEVKEGIIRRITNPDRSRIYGLPNWPYNELAMKVEAYFRERKEWQWSTTTLMDLANEVGVPPNEIEKLAYRYGKRYGVKIGTEIKKDVSYERSDEMMRRTALERKKKAWKFG